MFRSILVPLDGSRLAEWALPAAIRTASNNRAELELITIEIPIVPFETTDSLLDDAIEPWRVPADANASAYLDEMVRRVAQVCDVPVHKTIRDFKPRVPEAILQHARDAGSDLIVMTTHGYGPFKRFWLGSVADTVIRESKLPTLIVRPAEDAAADLTNQPRYRHVLIPLDGSEVSQTVINYATGVAGPDATFTLLRAVVPLPLPLLTPEFAVAGALTREAATVHDLEEQARTTLEQIAGRLRTRVANVKTVVMIEPFVASGILDYARDHAVDLIALTTHGRGGASRVLLGSTADKIVRGATMPVLVYRPA
jgi:nucleotide-binding universal stress UspA family protein